MLYTPLDLHTKGSLMYQWLCNVAYSHGVKFYLSPLWYDIVKCNDDTFVMNWDANVFPVGNLVRLHILQSKRRNIRISFMTTNILLKGQPSNQRERRHIQLYYTVTVTCICLVNLENTGCWQGMLKPECIACNSMDGPLKDTAPPLRQEGYSHPPTFS